MAAAPTIVGAGFGLKATVAQVEEPAESAEVELAHKIILRLRQGSPPAAMAAAVELVESIAAKYDLNGGAWM